MSWLLIHDDTAIKRAIICHLKLHSHLKIWSHNPFSSSVCFPKLRLLPLHHFYATTTSRSYLRPDFGPSNPEADRLCFVASRHRVPVPARWSPMDEPFQLPHCLRLQCHHSHRCHPHRSRRHCSGRCRFHNNHCFRCHFSPLHSRPHYFHQDYRADRPLLQ